MAAMRNLNGWNNQMLPSITSLTPTSKISNVDQYFNYSNIINQQTANSKIFEVQQQQHQQQALLNSNKFDLYSYVKNFYQQQASTTTNINQTNDSNGLVNQLITKPNSINNNDNSTNSASSYYSSSSTSTAPSYALATQQHQK
jgi:hypothetical protein